MMVIISKGSIDELRIYERPLTQQEVLSISSLTFSTCGFYENVEFALSSISNIFEDTSACPPVEFQFLMSYLVTIYTFDGMDYVNIESDNR